MLRITKQRCCLGLVFQKVFVSHILTLCVVKSDYLLGICSPGATLTHLGEQIAPHGSYTTMGGFYLGKAAGATAGMERLKPREKRQGRLHACVLG